MASRKRCVKTLLVGVHGGVTLSLALAASYFNFALFDSPLTPKDPDKAITSVWNYLHCQHCKFALAILCL